MSKIDSGRPRYIGETKDQLRDGFGVYQYPNNFFKYEGEWRNGVKHGHGKLAMKDGSFYEGQFINGEIEGMGVKKWTYNGNIYEGQFVKGELCGNGIMRYGNGDLYEGGWMDNMREGDGILTGANGSMYKGSFHKHKKHGEGTQAYRNDEQYEGGWICGMRHGHGIMKFADGSIYGGQWRSDMFNGQGSLIHCSGISYEGIWINGRPEYEVTDIIISENVEIEIEQGQTFSFEVECRTADREIPPECGRVLQVTAGVRTRFNVASAVMSPKQSAISSGSADRSKENLIISTPFGFDVEPYPIVELVVTEHTSEPVTTESGSASKGQSLLSPITDQSPGPEISSKLEELTVQDDKDKPPAEAVETDKSRVTFQDQNEGRYFPNQSSFNPAVTEDDKQDEANQEGEPIIAMRTVNGQVFFENIFLPPAHGLRRSLSRSSPESLDGRASTANKWKKNDAAFAGSTLKTPSMTGVTVEKDKKKGGTSEHGSITSESDKSRDLNPTPMQQKKRKDRKDDKFQDKEEKICKPGDYVVIIQDVTSPPFLDTTLKPAFLHVKVIPRIAKRSKSQSKK